MSDRLAEIEAMIAKYDRSQMEQEAFEWLVVRLRAAEQELHDAQDELKVEARAKWEARRARQEAESLLAEWVAPVHDPDLALRSMNWLAGVDKPA